MARPPKGKPLTFRPLRLDDDVWAECQRLGKEHGTINEGLRVAFGWLSPLANQGVKPVSVWAVARRPDNKVSKPPLLKPKERESKQDKC